MKDYLTFNNKAYLVNRAHEVLKYTGSICYKCGNLVETKKEGICPGPCEDGGDVHSLLETFEQRRGDKWDIGLRYDTFKNYQKNL